MLVQSRAGQTISDPDGNFNDEDYRDVGEAMMGWYEKGAAKKMFNPKMMLDVRSFLAVPEISALNKKAGFGDPQSKRISQGRWPKAVKKYLRFRELNPKMLESGVKSGFGGSMKNLSRQAGYKPVSQKYFEILRWEQVQSEGGHRTIGLDGTMKIEKQSFEGMTEDQIVEKITKEKLGFQTVMGSLTKDMGLTPNIMRALVETMSDKNVVLFIPTLEDLGLLKDKKVKERIDLALKEVEDERARNIAKNVRNVEMKGKMEAAADGALTKAVNQEVADRPLKILIGIDASGSMQGAIETSKEVVGRILPAFADQQDKISVQVFQMDSRTVKFKKFTKAGVTTALAGFSAGGGTSYSSSLFAAAKDGFKVSPEEDLILLFIGDEGGEGGAQVQTTLNYLGWKPAAIALVPVTSTAYGRGDTVRSTAQRMRVPLTEVDPKMIPDGDPYQLVRFLKNFLAAAIPTGLATAPRRETSLVEKILKMDLLTTADRKVLLAPVS